MLEDEPRAGTVMVDQYGNIHRLTSELARGGQGVVYRTTDADLAVKLPLSQGRVDRTKDLAENFRRVRRLPMPDRIPISLPLSILRDNPGYVMRLLSEMTPFGSMTSDIAAPGPEAEVSLPPWLADVPDPTTAHTLAHYARTGSTKRRLGALGRCAAILARLHSAGLVYGDISPNNCFVGEGVEPEVWLIDPDNLHLEAVRGGGVVYTPRYGAPEVVQRDGRGFPLDHSRPRSDAWAFAVMTFEVLNLIHPFIGQAVLEPEVDGGWDAEPSDVAGPSDLDERAYAGLLPYVDDTRDESNRALGGLPRTLTLTPQLERLFLETFGPGRSIDRSWRRPALDYWAAELMRAADLSLECPSCRMTYYVCHESCPYCDTTRPSFIRASTDRWQLTFPRSTLELQLPHRLFHPFSLARNADTIYRATVDHERHTVTHTRGTTPLPDDLSVEFVSEVQ